MRAGTSSEPIRAKTNTRLPGAAAHNSRCFLRFVGADDIPRSQLRQGLMTVRRRPPNVRSSGLRPLKWFNLAPQPSTASSCHHMPLPILAVHHLPPTDYSPAQALMLARHCRCATPLRACPFYSLISAPVGGDSGSRAPLMWAPTIGSKPRRLALPCKIFIVDVRHRSFSGLASPLTHNVYNSSKQP